MGKGIGPIRLSLRGRIAVLSPPWRLAAVVLAWLTISTPLAYFLETAKLAAMVDAPGQLMTISMSMLANQIMVFTGSLIVVLTGAWHLTRKQFRRPSYPDFLSEGDVARIVSAVANGTVQRWNIDRAFELPDGTGAEIMQREQLRLRKSGYPHDWRGSYQIP